MLELLSDLMQGGWPLTWSGLIIVLGLWAMLYITLWRR
jgi:hypothetical protein